jgi:hypothetical protein
VTTASRSGTFSISSLATPYLGLTFITAPIAGRRRSAPIRMTPLRPRE